MKANLENLSWRKFLLSLFALLGIGLFASGVVTWIASNWSYFDKWVKLFATQGLLAGLMLASLLLAKRGSSKNQIASIWFVVAVLIGALLALIGQIYQTGASPWQLFALWALLSLPLWLVLPNIAGYLLWLIITNTAIFLYFQDWDHHLIYLLMAVNALFLVLSEFFAKHFDHWRVLPRILAIYIAILVTIFNISFQNEIFCLILLAGFYFYKRHRFDLVISVAYLCAIIVNLDIFLLNHYDSYILYFLFPLNCIALFGAVYLLNRWLKEKYPQMQGNIAVVSLYLILAILCLGFLIALLEILNIFSPFVLLVIAFPLYFLAYLCRKTKPHYSAVLFLLGMLFIATYEIWQLFEYQQSFLLLLWLSLLFAYLVQPIFWLRLIALCLGIFFSLFWLTRFGEDYLFLLNYIQLACLPLAVWLFYFSVKQPKLRPLAWSLLLVSFWFELEFFLLVGSFSEADELPEIINFLAFFDLINQNMFMQLAFDWRSFCYLCLLISPLMVFFLLNLGLTAYQYTVALCGLVFFCLAFSGSVVLCGLLALLLLSYYQKSLRLFVLILLAIIIFLSRYYYWLAIPLLYKSVLLVSVGVLFICITFLLRKPSVVKNKQIQFKVKNSFLLTALCCLLCILGIANFAIVTNEDVLRNGQPIIVKLAPQDPRSLMQGDYMQLNYDLLFEINEQFSELDNHYQRIYALVQFDQKNVAHLCRIEYQQPTDFSGCEQGIYLPIKLGNYWSLSLPSHQYFFPEGMAKYYSQAKYGEYRFKDGKAILARLLDAEFKPL